MTKTYQEYPCLGLSDKTRRPLKYRQHWGGGSERLGQGCPTVHEADKSKQEWFWTYLVLWWSSWRQGDFLKPFKSDQLLHFHSQFLWHVIDKGWQMIFPQTLENLPGSGTALVLDVPATFLRHGHAVIPGMERPSDFPGFCPVTSSVAWGCIEPCRVELLVAVITCSHF